MRKKKTERKPLSFSEAIGFKNMFQNEKAVFLFGVILLAISILMICSFVSYFSTGAADQSLLENPRGSELLNATREFQNYCGSIGAYTAFFLIKRCFGIPAFLIPIFLIFVSLKKMGAYSVNLWKWFFCTMIVMIWSSITLAKFISPIFVDSFFNPGGDHGMYVCQCIENLIGPPGITAVLAFTALAFLTYLTNETISVVRKMLNPVKYITKVGFTITNNSRKGTDDSDNNIKTEEDPAVFDDPAIQKVEFVGSDAEIVTLDNPVSDKNESVKPAVSHSSERLNISDGKEMNIITGKEEEKADNNIVVGGITMDKYDPKRDLENYHYPTLDLLKKYENDGKPYIDMAEQTANKNRIVEVLKSFGVEIRTISATVGPTITLYEVTPAEGIRISRIRNLEDDIALSLSALGIRIIAPIPGKGTIGIEVPNAKPNIVSMESILNSKKFQETNMKLPIALGKTISNEVFMVDLAKIPHLLVAGATGQGKSVGLNAIITSLLYKKHPAELKLVLIDPKKVEFSIYRTIANYFLAKIPEEDDEPIITDVTKVVKTLNSLCKEMDQRYDLLKLAGVRKVEEYNEKFKNRQLNPEHGHKFMPYIVVIIDEFGDLIMTAGKEIEMPIARIAQLARAVGIHMVIATQRPTTTIITGNIKANFPGRMAFKVSSMMDSRIILDRPGANQLIGRGDMLFLSGNEPVRVQCAFVDTPEVDRINKYIAQQQGYPSPFELPEPDSPNEDGIGTEMMDLQHVDPLFEEAARLIVLNQQGSTSLIQRKFSIGYNRAGRLMDQLEKSGIVGAAQGSKPREVMITDENSLEQLLNGIRR